MNQLMLKIEEGTRLLLKKLDSRRMRDVLEKRFGLKGGSSKTLDAIGKEYKITRERVRQIEAEGLKRLGDSEVQKELIPLFESLQGHMHEHGGSMAENHMTTTLVTMRTAPHLNFLLTVGKMFNAVPETNLYHSRWATSTTAPAVGENVIAETVNELRATGHPVSSDELNAIVSKYVTAVSGVASSPARSAAYLATSKLIRKNPYGEYGLVEWPHINPRGVKDKAYSVLSKHGKPMHFREVASAINLVGWSRRKAHPQTVHNELIKDARFILVGRGLYALREWGYEPGTVGDVLVSVMKHAAKPLEKEAIVQLVLEKRFVKPNTILLNLQNKTLFRRTGEGKFILV